MTILRTIQNLTVHAAAMYHGKTRVPQLGNWNSIGIKKACGNEAIGEDCRPQNRYTIILLSDGKGKKKKRDDKEKREENLHDSNILTFLGLSIHKN